MPIVRDKDTELEKACLRTQEGTTAEVYLFGAHIVSFVPHGGQEVIFVSDQAVFKPPKAIRGGVPVCWPQFNDMGPLQGHGFARNSTFSVKSISEDQVVLQLQSSDVEQPDFKHDWELLVTVAVTDANGGTLNQTVTCTNKGQSTMKTTQALHTYFRISDVANVTVKGLEGCPYLDNLEARVRKEGSSDGISIAEEVDRIYISTGKPIAVEDSGAGRAIVCEVRGFNDAVVWNPWTAKAAALKDFGDEEFRSMVCVEPANAAMYLEGTTVDVEGGAEWEASQSIHLRSL